MALATTLILPQMLPLLPHSETLFLPLLSVELDVKPCLLTAWCACNVIDADFHVNYHSLKCEPLTTTFVYQLNQSVLLSSVRTDASTSPASDGRDREPQSRSVADFGSKLADACATVQSLDEDGDDCRRESSLLFLLLMLGTVWLGLSLYNFTKTSVPIGLCYC